MKIRKPRRIQMVGLLLGEKLKLGTDYCLSAPITHPRKVKTLFKFVTERREIDHIVYCYTAFFPLCINVYF